MDPSKKIILIFRARLHRNHKFCKTSQTEIPPSCTLRGLDFRCLSREQSVQPQKKFHFEVSAILADEHYLACILFHNASNMLTSTGKVKNIFISNSYCGHYLKKNW